MRLVGQDKAAINTIATLAPSLVVTGPRAEASRMVAIRALHHLLSRRVNLRLLDEGSVRPGDCVPIHMGFALERVDEENATQAPPGPGADGARG